MGIPIDSAIRKTKKKRVCRLRRRNAMRASDFPLRNHPLSSAMRPDQIQQHRQRQRARHSSDYTSELVNRLGDEFLVNILEYGDADGDGREDEHTVRFEDTPHVVTNIDSTSEAVMEGDEAIRSATSRLSQARRLFLDALHPNSADLDQIEVNYSTLRELEGRGEANEEQLSDDLPEDLLNEFLSHGVRYLSGRRSSETRQSRLRRLRRFGRLRGTAEEQGEEQEGNNSEATRESRRARHREVFLMEQGE